MTSGRLRAVAGNGDRHLGRPRSQSPFPRPAQQLLRVHIVEDGWPRQVEQSIDPVALAEPPGDSDQENPANEAKVGDKPVITQRQHLIALAANSGVDWALDKEGETAPRSSR